MNRLNVKDLKPKVDIESTFFVKYIALGEAKDGKKYLNIILADSTGDLECRSWANAEEIYSDVEKGDFVKVNGKVNLYQGRKQFIIKSISKLDKAEVNKEEFEVRSEQDPEEMFIELKDIINNLTDVYIRDLLLNVVNDNEISRRLKLWQAGKSIHHSYKSGLLEHILSCSKLGVSLSITYKVNVNYVVAGCILHDLCKVYELTDGLNVEYTEEGKLVGHLVKGVEMVDRFSYRIKGFPYQTKLHLKHILLSHHGEYEYGSPKIPQTSEAMLVHLIDFMDSKMHSFETAKRNDNNSGHWTGFVKHLDRIIFKDELPFYPEYIESNEKPKVNNKSKTNQEARSEGAMANALKNFKI